eukprot:TRINITY_DN31970_c0_g1_i1.p1 TRINITY_DN31970_c0_g1~~TRINITY_DN31970_c0_g1_i1.p1  ORF type:complete len:101 (-),score=9.50 TRINITY_DN31970_c0_g1_i1:530-832(-)
MHTEYHSFRATAVRPGASHVQAPPGNNTDCLDKGTRIRDAPTTRLHDGRQYVLNFITGVEVLLICWSDCSFHQQYHHTSGSGVDCTTGNILPQLRCATGC